MVCRHVAWLLLDNGSNRDFLAELTTGNLAPAIGFDGARTVTVQAHDLGVVADKPG
jgi:hypothetical protein